MNLRHQGGFILLEGLLAVAIFSVGLLAVVGLQAMAVSSVNDAKYRADAAQVADQIIARMWIDQARLADYVGTDLPLAAGERNTASVTNTLPNATKTIALNGTRVAVTINWRPPDSATTHSFTTETQITGG